MKKEITIKYNNDTYIVMSAYNYDIMCKNKEIERLTAESTKWESKFYDEAKKNDKAIEYIEKHTNRLVDNLDIFEVQDIVNILQGVDKE